MPIYAYRCTACGCEKDVLQKISDPVLTTCPACKTENFVKKLTAPVFQLKGTGWYATDFKGGGTKPAGADGQSDSASKGSDTASKTEGATSSGESAAPATTSGAASTAASAPAASATSGSGATSTPT